MNFFYCAAIATSCAAIAAATPLTARQHSPEPRSIFTVNVANVRAGKLEAARRYYELGWLPARREALRRGDIRSFRLLAATREDATQPEFVLITEFAAGLPYETREARFRAIFAKLGQSGPITADGLSRDDIFESLSGLDDYQQIEMGMTPR